MRRLLPVPDGTPAPEVDDAALTRLYDAEGPLVRANMVVSLDGRTSGPDGLSGTLSTQADRTVFSLLRAWCDVVLVGAGTARAEGYRPARVRERWRRYRETSGRTEPPRIAIVSRSLDLDPASDLLREGRPIVITSRAADPARRTALAGVADVVMVGDEDVDPVQALAALREAGLERVLLEGGPALLRSALSADIVDELCLTVTPTMVGGEGHTLLGPGTTAIGSGWHPLHVLEEDGTLLLRYARTRP